MLAEFFVGLVIICIPMMLGVLVAGIIETIRERKAK